MLSQSFIIYCYNNKHNSIQKINQQTFEELGAAFHYLLANMPLYDEIIMANNENYCVALSQQGELVFPKYAKGKLIYPQTVNGQIVQMGATDVFYYH